MENETLEQLTIGLLNDADRFVYSTIQNLVIGGLIDDNFRKAVDIAVMSVESCKLEAILTAVDRTIFPRVQMALRLITSSSGHGQNSVVQYRDQKDFTGNTEITPLVSALSQFDLTMDQDKTHENRDNEKLEDGDFPALKYNNDRRARTHHMATGHIARQISISDFLTGRPTQNNPLPHQFTQPQNNATHPSLGNTLPMLEQTPEKQN